MARFNFTLLTILLIVAIPYYWFLIDSSAPAAQPRAVSIAQLRKVAAEPGKALPVRVRYERIASQSAMGNRVAAGTGLRSIRLHTLSYLVDYGQGAPVLIGAGMSKADARRFEHNSYAAMAQVRVTRALARSRALVPLSMAPEQLGALRMIEGSQRATMLDADMARQQQADRKGAAHRVAPGVVVIPTPQVEAGSRMVYVRLANGREYLFAGKLAPIQRNWADPRLPARFVTDLGQRNDRKALLSWLLTIRKLRQQAPALVVVPGHRIPKRGGLLRFFDESALIQ